MAEDNQGSINKSKPEPLARNKSSELSTKPWRFPRESSKLKPTSAISRYSGKKYNPNLLDSSRPNKKPTRKPESTDPEYLKHPSCVRKLIDVHFFGCDVIDGMHGIEEHLAFWDVCLKAQGLHQTQLQSWSTSDHLEDKSPNLFSFDQFQDLLKETSK